MELLDIITKEGLPTGITKNRKEVHKSGDLHGVVHVWVYDKDKNLILQKRHRNKKMFPEFWDISCAGHIKSGETPEEAVWRELQEELSLEPSDLHGLEFINKIHETWRTKKLINDEIAYIYATRLQSKVEFIAATCEVTGIEVVPLEHFRRLIEIPDNGMVPHPEEYKMIINYLKTYKFI